MNVKKISQMTKGWFIGDFEPSLLKTQNVEVAVKNYIKGDFEELHYHKIATEITVVVSGLVSMNGVVYREGDIIIIEPFESTNFKALENTVTTVVKLPGAINDKYIGIYKND
jgi:hypothetical protein